MKEETNSIVDQAMCIISIEINKQKIGAGLGHFHINLYIPVFITLFTHVHVHVTSVGSRDGEEVKAPAFHQRGQCES